MSRKTKKVWHHAAISVLITFLILCCIMLALSGKRESRLQSIIKLLKSENIEDYVVKEITSTVVLEKEEKSSLFGVHRGLLIAEVTVFFGFDIAELDDDSLQIKKDKTLVSMPDVKILRLSVDTDSMRFFNNRMFYLKEQSVDGQHMQEIVKTITSYAPYYFANHKMLPAREEMLKDLQAQIKLVNTTVEFQ